MIDSQQKIISHLNQTFLSPVSQEEINLPLTPAGTLYQQKYCQFTLKGFQVYTWVFPVAKEIRIAGL